MTSATSTRVVVVTGGTRGIGRAIVQKLAQQGFSVIFTYKSNKAIADDLLQELKQINNLSHEAHQCDMQDANKVKHLFKDIFTRTDKIHALINNVGITGPGKFFMMMPETEWWDIFMCNFQSTSNTIRCVLNNMVKHKSGIIINITSLSAKEGTQGSSAYAASKAAIIALSKSLFREMANLGVRIYCLSPGLIKTDMTQDASIALIEKRINKSPLRRFGTPEEVASVVSFLADNPPALLGGSNIEIDGLQ